jgi:hypothetical protein
LIVSSSLIVLFLISICINVQFRFTLFKSEMIISIK